MMKKTFILTLLLGTLFATCRAADESYDYLVFTLDNGSQQAVAASNLSLSFADGNLTATSGTATLLTLPLAQLAKMEFSNTGTAGIAALPAATGTDGAVYDLNGRKIAGSLSAAGQLPRGIYIVKGKERSLKLQVK